MRRKKQKPPICIGGSEKLRAMDRPRYMNVPSPAPCHVNVAGVGKQSVRGLRIIPGSQLSLLHHSTNSSIAKRNCLTYLFTGRGLRYIRIGHNGKSSGTENPNHVRANSVR